MLTNGIFSRFGRSASLSFPLFVQSLTISVFEGRTRNCSELFSPAITDSGICCAFNLNTDLKDSLYKQLVDEMKVGETRLGHLKMQLCATHFFIKFIFFGFGSRITVDIFKYRLVV